MSDTLMAIIGILVAVILMFIFPLVDFTGKNDEIAQTVAQVAVSEFVNTVATQGKITEFDYNQLVQKLYSTGNTYDIQIEVQILDDNPRRVTTTGSHELVGEYKYYSVYTNTILEDIENEEKNNEYKLKKDDYIIVTVKNSNITLGTQFKNIFYKIIGQETSAIGTSSSAVVVNSSNTKIEPAVMVKLPQPEPTPEPEPAPFFPEKTIKVIATKTEEITTNLGNNLDLVVILDCEPKTMPHHNALGDSKDFLNNIINAVSGKGNLSFILTCDPDTIHTNLENLDWIYNAYLDQTRENYNSAISTALETVKNKEGYRIIVFLSWYGYADRVVDQLYLLKDNSSDYDICFTTLCCGNSASRINAVFNTWQAQLGSKKYGGHLKGNDIGAKFESLTKQPVPFEKDVENEYYVDSQNQILTLPTKSDKSKKIEIKINDTTYELGKDIPINIIYEENGVDKLNLEFLRIILNILVEDWNSTQIELYYSQE